MIHAAASSESDASQPVAIIVRPRSGVWRVDLNGSFYGDYTRRDWAIEAGLEKADDLAARGGAAVVKTLTDAQEEATLYDTRGRRFATRAC